MTIPGSDPSGDDPSGDDPSSDPSSDPTSDPAGTAPAAKAGTPVRGARRLALHFGVVLLGASALAATLGGVRAALSAALGVALAGINLLLMQKITSAMMAVNAVGANEGASSDGAGNPAWGLALPFKLVALVGVAYALVRSGVAQPVPLAMGFALLPLTGVFLPRPMSVSDLQPPRARRASSHPSRRHDATPPRRGQPAA